MSDVIQKQRELYKNHLEFLGYQVEYDSDDGQQITALHNGTRTFMRIFNNGLRASRMYSTSPRAASNRLALLEFINSSNGEGIAKFFVGNDWLVIELWYLCAYEKVSFGGFINTIEDESEKFISSALKTEFFK